MYAGIDIGYDSTKVMSGERKAAFKSVVGTPERSRFSLGQNGTDMVLNDKDGTWLIGDTAIEQSRFVNRREDGAWYKSTEYRLLKLAAFGQLTTGTSVKMIVVTGLPVNYYEVGKEEVKTSFTGQHRVEIEGRTPQRIEVTTCRVIPQPFGAVLSLAMNDAGKIVDKALAEGPVGVIDIGGKTTNLLSVKGLNEVSKETSSINIGMWDAARAVRDYLVTKHPEIELRDHELMDAIRNREVWCFDERVDLTKIVSEVIDNMAHTIISTATQLWHGGARLRAILIAGGGAYVLGEQIKNEFRHARIVDDPRFANATGYFKLATFLAQNS